MGTSVGVGPFRTLSTIPAAISRLDRSIGASTTTSLRKSCFEWSSPSTKRFQRPGCGLCPVLPSDFAYIYKFSGFLFTLIFGGGQQWLEISYWDN